MQISGDKNAPVDREEYLFVTKIEKKRAMGCKLLKFYFYIDHNLTDTLRLNFIAKRKQQFTSHDDEMRLTTIANI